MIREGLATHPNGNIEVFAGGFLVVVLAMIAEEGLGALQRAVTPRGLRLADPQAAAKSLGHVEEPVGVR